jgi:myo-inositol-1-phosphate synthase
MSSRSWRRAAPSSTASRCSSLRALLEQAFAQRGLPIIGDDIKSQVGATIVHRMLTDLFRKRGVKVDRTYQLNVGGNTDFLNMLERERLLSKKISKTQAVTSQLGHPMRARRARRPERLRAVAGDRKWSRTSAWRAPPSATCRCSAR